MALITIIIIIILVLCFIYLLTKMNRAEYMMQIYDDTGDYLNNIQFDNKISLNDIVDKIYVINLNRRPDRMERMKKILKEYNIVYERFPAIDGNDINVMAEWYNIKNTKNTKNTIISTVNAYGCLLSHLEIIKLAKKNNYKRVLIFEDDLRFHKNFDNEIKKIRYLPDNWKILYLGASQITIDINNIPKNNFYYHANKTDGAFAYIVDSSIYDEVIKLLETKIGPVDYLYKFIQDKYPSYVLYPNIIIANVAESNTRNYDISNKEVISWSKRLGWNLDDYHN